MENEQMELDFAGVLRGALALPEEDKRRLAEVMSRVTDSSPAVGTTVALAGHPPQAVLEEPHVTAAEWVRKIRDEPAWDQLQLLEDAIERADDPSELQVLQTAHKTLLQENPPLAVRRAVVRLASQHPVGICVGASGLLLALTALGRGLVRLAF